MQERQAGQTGWKTAFDIAVAPRAAFAALRTAPTWGWAFFIAALLGIGATFAMSPVVERAAERDVAAQFAAAPGTSGLPSDQRDARLAQEIQFARTAVRFAFVFVPVGLAAGCAVQALVMLVGNALGGGDGTFGKFWALAVNAGVVGTGIASLALMAIVLLRGQDGFGSVAEIGNAVPGLGMLVPPQAKGASAFFGALTIFTLWDGILLAGGMTVVACIPRGIAIATALLIVLGAGVLPLVSTALAK